MSKKNTSEICVTLTAYNMGNIDHVDYDCWISFVRDQIDEGTGVEVASVEAVGWAYPQPAEDRASGGTAEQREAILSWLAHEGWDAFCGDEWNARRRAREAGDKA